MFTTVVSGLEGRARYVTSLLQDRAGVVWVGTHDGLYRVTVAQGQPVDLAAVDLGLPDRDNRREITCLMEDRRGALWIGTMQSLHRRSADGRVEPIVPSSRADLLTIHALLEDRDGSVWVGTRYGGLFHLTVDSASHRPTVRHVYAAPRDLPTNWITTIVQSADGAVWVGSNRGVFHFLPGPDGTPTGFVSIPRRRDLTRSGRSLKTVSTTCGWAGAMLASQSCGIAVSRGSSRRMACPGRTRSTRLGTATSSRWAVSIWKSGACAASTERSSSPANVQCQA